MSNWIYAVPKAPKPKVKRKLKSKKKGKPTSKSIWTVSGGLPSLGKRAR